MTRDEMMNALTEIGTCEDDVTRRTLLSGLTDAIAELHESNATLSQQNEQYVADNETLRSANMKLFLQIGTPTELTNPLGESEKKELKYEDLFNEKGELK